MRIPLTNPVGASWVCGYGCKKKGSSGDVAGIAHGGSPVFAYVVRYALKVSLACGMARPCGTWRGDAKLVIWASNHYWSATSTGGGSHAKLNLNYGSSSSQADSVNGYVALEVV